jgi:hypothetical protein
MKFRRMKIDHRRRMERWTSYDLYLKRIILSQRKRLMNESVKAENVRRVKRKKVGKQEAISNINYFEPPKELKKLLDVIGLQIWNEGKSLVWH